MANVRKGPSVLLVVTLCLSAFSFSNSEYLSEESQRLNKYGQLLLANINRDIDPCQDFASYVNNEIDVKKMDDFGYNEIKSAYDTFIAGEVGLSRTDSKAKDFYDSCMEHLPETYLDAITELNIARSVLEFRTLDKFGPTVYGEDNTAFSWSKLVGVLQGFDVTAFVSGYATASEHGTMTFHLAPGKFDLTQTEFWNGDLKSVLQYYGLGESEIFELTRSLEEFERKFSVRETTKVKTNMTIGDLQTKFPDFEWEHYFQILADTNRDINEYRKVIVTDLEKIEEFYNAHNFPELAETAVVYYFLKVHAKLNMEYYAVKNDKRMCLINTFNLFKEVFANIMQQNLDENDMENLKDVIIGVSYAIIDIGGWEARWAIEPSLKKLENDEDLEAQKAEYKEYVGDSFPFFTDTRYLSNYLRAYNSHRIRQIANKYKDNLDKIGFYYYIHLKPRLVLLGTFGYKIAFIMLKQFDVHIDKGPCQEFYDGIAPYKVIVDALDAFKPLGPSKIRNEVDVLSKIGLTPKQLMHILYGKILVGQHKGQSKSTLSSVFLRYEEFRNSYECSTPSDINEDCHL